MSIVPDTKNWTWVLERPCPECGFDASTWRAEDVGAAIRAQPAVWSGLLQHPRAAERPSAAQWSATEYGCHVRDVFRLFAHRLERMLLEDAPEFENWDQDVTAIEDRYDIQRPNDVLAGLVPAGEHLADVIASVATQQWERTGHRSDGATFTVRTFLLYLLHDPVHHVWDVERGYVELNS